MELTALPFLACGYRTCQELTPPRHPSTDHNTLFRCHLAGERTCGCYSCDETVALDETLESVLVLTILVVVRAFLTLSTIRRDRGPLAVVARESPRRSKESRTN